MAVVAGTVRDATLSTWRCARMVSLPQYLGALASVLVAVVAYHTWLFFQPPTYCDSIHPSETATCVPCPAREPTLTLVSGCSHGRLLCIEPTDVYEADPWAGMCRPVPVVAEWLAVALHEFHRNTTEQMCDRLDPAARFYLPVQPAASARGDKHGAAVVAAWLDTLPVSPRIDALPLAAVPLSSPGGQRGQGRGGRGSSTSSSSRLTRGQAREAVVSLLLQHPELMVQAGRLQVASPQWPAMWRWCAIEMRLLAQLHWVVLGVLVAASLGYARAPPTHA